MASHHKTNETNSHGLHIQTNLSTTQFCTIQSRQPNTNNVPWYMRLQEVDPAEGRVKLGEHHSQEHGDREEPTGGRGWVHSVVKVVLRKGNPNLIICA